MRHSIKRIQSSSFFLFPCYSAKGIIHYLYHICPIEGSILLQNMENDVKEFSLIFQKIAGNTLRGPLCIGIQLAF